MFGLFKKSDHLFHQSTIGHKIEIIAIIIFPKEFTKKQILLTINKAMGFRKEEQKHLLKDPKKLFCFPKTSKPLKFIFPFTHLTLK